MAKKKATKKKAAKKKTKRSTKKKKAAKEDLASLTIPQREQRALEQLGNYLEEVGGESSHFFIIDGLL